MKYLIVIEATATGFSAYSPDVPGCIATARTREDIESVMREAIEFHLEGLQMAGEVLPLPQSAAAYVEVTA
jgi:predicted RNase H-like HicB family nuclease